MKKEAPASRDFREFLFTATGKETQPGNLDDLDVMDNVAGELERLGAVADLMMSVREDVGVATLGGLALVLGDIHRRLAEVMRLWRTGQDR